MQEEFAQKGLTVVKPSASSPQYEVSLRNFRQELNKNCDFYIREFTKNFARDIFAARMNPYVPGKQGLLNKNDEKVLGLRKGMVAFVRIYSEPVFADGESLKINIIILHARSRKVLKSLELIAPSVSHRLYEVGYMFLDRQDLISVGLLPYNWATQDNSLNFYVDICSGRLVDNRTGVNTFMRFHGYEPHKFCFDRLNDSPEFKTLVPNKKIEHLMNMRSFMENQVASMHPFVYNSKIYYIALLVNLNGLFVYDEYLKSVGNGINVRNGKDYFCQIGHSIGTYFKRIYEDLSGVQQFENPIEDSYTFRVASVNQKGLWYRVNLINFIEKLLNS